MRQWTRSCPFPSTADAETGAPGVWRRTWPDSHHDFVLEIGGRTVARLYRHNDNTRWRWFGQVAGAPSGICDTRVEAIAAVNEFVRRDLA